LTTSFFGAGPLGGVTVGFFERGPLVGVVGTLVLVSDFSVFVDGLISAWSSLF